MAQKSPQIHRMPAAQRWSRRAAVCPCKATIIEYHGARVKIDNAMARTSISRPVTTMAANWTRVEPRAGDGREGRMTRQKRIPVTTKLGAISQVNGQSCQEA